MFSSSLQQNHFLVILQSCQNILLAKSSMLKYGMKKLDGEVFFIKKKFVATKHLSSDIYGIV